jgi:hypothetical protein
MKKLILVFLLSFLALLATACGGAPNSGVIPAQDKLTFLFFYTDG